MYSGIETPTSGKTTLVFCPDCDAMKEHSYTTRGLGIPHTYIYMCPDCERIAVEHIETRKTN